MKKKMFICGALSMTLLSTSCLGSFSAFNSLRDWNDGLTSNKFLDNLIFWALNIVPVYGLFMAGDVLFFNVLEFWTGSNPIAMAEGDEEVQYAEVNGQKVKMTATQNQFHIEVLSGENQGETLEMVYTPENKTWNALDENGEFIKLASMEEGFYMVYTPEGEAIQLDPTASKEQNLAILQGKVADYEDSMWADAR
jgi:hypothetical protein